MLELFELLVSVVSVVEVSDEYLLKKSSSYSFGEFNDGVFLAGLL
jgi:hypothetical protein